LAVILLTGYNAALAQTNSIAKADTSALTNLHLSGFSGIKIGGPFDVHITQGSEESVTMQVPEDVKNRITTEVVGGVLKIRKTHDNWGQGEKSWYSDKSVWRNHKKIIVYITAKSLNFISMSGSGHITFAEGVNAESLKLRVRGSGVLQGKIAVKVLKSSISGSGKIELSGNASSSTTRISGSGEFAARGLLTANSAVRVSGSGHAEINASDKVDAVLHGSANVNYTGDAKIVNTSKSGSAEVRRF